MTEDELFRAYGMRPGPAIADDEKIVHTPQRPPPVVTEWVRSARVPYNWRSYLQGLSTPIVEHVDNNLLTPEYDDASDGVDGVVASLRPAPSRS